MLSALLLAAATGAAAAGLAGWARGGTDRPDSAWLRTPVVAALGVGSGLLAGLRMESGAEALAFLVVGLVFALLFATDLAAQLIPHRVMWPGMLALLAGLTLAAAWEGSWRRLGGALLIGVVTMVCYFVIGWFGRGQFGLGDVSLSLFMGTFLGWLGVAHALVGAVGAFLVYVPVALTMLALRRAGRATEFAFGPCMIVAAWVAAFAGPALLGAVLPG
ncbi:MAG: A24 family peptidase [Actinomycetia bacterium]|nr:A24 family peptidase [Actinomycetes bacterium]